MQKEEIVDISSNQLSQVDLTKLPNSLTHLYLHYNQLSQVDLTKLPNSLTKLNL